MDIYLYSIGGRTNVQNLLNSYVLSMSKLRKLSEIRGIRGIRNRNHKIPGGES